jgi:hypothetical protein
VEPRPLEVEKSVKPALRLAGRRVALARLLRHPRPGVLAAAKRVRRKMERSAERRFLAILGLVRRRVSPEDLARIATRAWARRKWLGLKKANSGPDDVIGEVLARLRAATQGVEGGAMEGYLGLARDVGAVAGQATLDQLGIDATWRWTGVRQTIPDLYQARGSKIIQGLYGEHLDQLAALAARAADPANPMTIDQVTASIKAQWSDLETWQARRIARTETAIMWEKTSSSAMSLNGITRVEWIDFNAEDELCLDNVAYGMVPMGESFPSGDSEPPAHPNCICDLIPVLIEEDGSHWLPPAEPFTGNDPPLATMPAMPFGAPPLPLAPDSVALEARPLGGANSISVSEADKKARQYVAQLEAGDPQELGMVRALKRGHLERLQEQLRADAALSPNDVGIREALDRAVGKAKPITGNGYIVYRGAADLPALRVGETFVDRGFVTGSVKLAEARSWMAESARLVELHVPAGEPMAFISDAAVGGGDATGEVMLGRGTEWQLVEVKRDRYVFELIRPYSGPPVPVPIPLPAVDAPAAAAGAVRDVGLSQDAVDALAQLQKARSLGGVEKALGRMMSQGSASVDFAGINEDSARIIARTIIERQGEAETLGLRAQLDGLRVQLDMHGASDAYAMTQTGARGEIVFNARYYGGEAYGERGAESWLDALYNQVQADVRAKFHPPFFAESPEAAADGIASHEYGHFLQWRMKGMATPDDVRALADTLNSQWKDWIAKKADAVFGDTAATRSAADAIRLKSWAEAEPFRLNSGMDLHWGSYVRVQLPVGEGGQWVGYFMKDQLSGYALESPHEFFAEAYSEWASAARYGAEVRPVARAVGEWTDALLRRFGDEASTADRFAAYREIKFPDLNTLIGARAPADTQAVMDYLPIRAEVDGALRSGQVPADLQKIIDALDKSIAGARPLEFDGAAYSGGAATNMEVGDIIAEPGYLTAHMTVGEADVMGGDRFTFLLQRGTKFQVDVHADLLLPRGSGLEVVAKSDLGGGRTGYVVKLFNRIESASQPAAPDFVAAEGSGVSDSGIAYNFRHFTDDGAKELYQTMEDLARQYPRVAERIASVSETPSTFSGQTFVDERGWRLTVSSDLQPSAEAWPAKVGRAAEHVGGGIRGTAIHEFGHMFDHGLWAKVDPELQAWWDAEYATLKGARSISQYAATSDRELVAEAFSAWKQFGTDAPKLAQKIGRAIDEWANTEVLASRALQAEQWTVPSEAEFKAAAQEAYRAAAEAEFKNAHFYTGSGHGPINAFLRTGESPQDLTSTVRSLDGWTTGQQFGSPTVLWRGGGIGSGADLEVGSTFADPAFVSTSLDQAQASSFGGDLWEIRAPSGTSFGYGAPGEGEAILPRGSMFEVQSVEDIGGGRLKYVVRVVQTPTAPSAAIAPAPTRIASELARRITEEGGFTVVPGTGETVAAGKAVAIPGHELALQVDDQLQANVQRWLDQNADALSQPGANIGGWVDRATGKAYLDVSVTVPDAETAARLAREYDQLAYFDLDTGAEVRVADLAPEDSSRYEQLLHDAGIGVPDIPAQQELGVPTDFADTTQYTDYGIERSWGTSLMEDFRASWDYRQDLLYSDMMDNGRILQINRALRGTLESDFTVPQAIEKGGFIDDYIADYGMALESETTVFRGAAKGVVPEAVGADFSDPGFLYTSVLPQHAASFASYTDGPLIRITLSEGTIVMPGRAIGEGEIVLQRGLRFRVAAVHEELVDFGGGISRMMKVIDLKVV